MNQRRTPRRKKGSRGGGSAPVSRSEVMSLIRANNKLMIEDKVTYTTQNGGIDYNGSVFNLLGVLVRGDAAVDQYTGNLIRPTSLRMIGTVSTNQTFNSMRIVIFQWLDASNPVPAGVWQLIGSSNAPFSTPAWLNVHKVHVLYDHLIAIAPVAGSYAIEKFSCFLTNCFRTVQMSNAGVNPQMAGIYCLAISDDGAPVYPQLLFNTELRFTDA